MSLAVFSSYKLYHLFKIKIFADCWNIIITVWCLSYIILTIFASQDWMYFHTCVIAVTAYWCWLQDKGSVFSAAENVNPDLQPPLFLFLLLLHYIDHTCPAGRFSQPRTFSTCSNPHKNRKHINSTDRRNSASDTTPCHCPSGNEPLDHATMI